MVTAGGAGGDAGGDDGSDGGTVAVVRDGFGADDDAPLVEAGGRTWFAAELLSGSTSSSTSRALA